MANGRRTSWMAEVEQTKPRKGRAPSIPHLAPFDLSVAPNKASRSSSFPATSIVQEEPNPLSRVHTHGNSPSSAIAPNDGGFSPIGYMPMQSPTINYGMNQRKHRDSFGMSEMQNALPKLNAKKTPQEVSDEEMEFRSIRELYSPSATPDPSAGPHMEPTVYCVVGFKANRAEVYVRESATQFAAEIRPGQDVIVEADRGQDIGHVLFTTTSLYKADRYARTMNLKHHRELVRSSFRFSHKWRDIELPHVALPNGNEANRRVKVIKRMATNVDLLSIYDKENMEARCKRICQDLVMRHRLDMEVLEAEWQADYQRLTFFYFSPNYVVFNNLVHDLFRIFKKRIWMSSVNASTAGRAGGLANYSPPKDHAYAARPSRFGMSNFEGGDHIDLHQMADASKKAYEQVLQSINSYNPSRFELTKSNGGGGGVMGPGPAPYGSHHNTVASMSEEAMSPAAAAEYAAQAYNAHLQSLHPAFEQVPRPFGYNSDTHATGGYGLGHGGYVGSAVYNKESSLKKQGVSGFY